MDTQGYDLLVKTLEGAPLPALFAIAIWFLIWQFWPWYRAKEERRIKADEEYKSSWLAESRTFREHIEARLQDIEDTLVDIRYDHEAVLMILAKDRPDLIEFFKHRDAAHRRDVNRAQGA